MCFTKYIHRRTDYDIGDALLLIAGRMCVCSLFGKEAEKGKGVRRDDDVRL